ncbi:MAG: ATP-binding protein [Alphaproteobacteria bacterium]|jgi:predicted kinase|nr:ATP-binding protein [Alphaproteobacteria bacterium]MBT4018137.1 ATP-binding protein [Alphaproteobacteria bacterium]MBT4965703.1 ATP-binding protein [Alphaproteobacteria bacterium]MBT5160194.1 ATP-binding protein [Alphaproteobacteria bacterium]MBT5918066.1 ATP-binding protein [Alphaproteobacteria bacterium]
MSSNEQTVHFLCGKIAAGKSTLAHTLAAQPMTVLVSEDHWLGQLYPGEIATLDDYVRCSKNLRGAMEPHIVSMLKEGLSIVLDFPANTLRQRQWLHGLCDAAQVSHQLHFLDVPDDVCKQRLQKRNMAGEHAFQTSDENFELVTSYFVPPTALEGFNIIRHALRHPALDAGSTLLDCGFPET